MQSITCVRCTVLAVLANVTNSLASAGTTKAPKIYPPWHNKSVTKDMWFKIEAYEEMERQLVASNEKCEKAEATNRQLMLDTAELGQRLSRVESELAQERVDREQERSQDAHLIKELRKALRTVRDIVRASLAAMRGDPPSVTGQHAASKKRPRDEDEDDRVGLQELVDSLMA